MHWSIFSVSPNRACGFVLLCLISGQAAAQTLTVPPNITPPPGSTFTEVTINSGGNLTADGLIITPGGATAGITANPAPPSSATGVFTNTTIIPGSRGIDANGSRVTITMGAGSSVVGFGSGVRVRNGARVNFINGAFINITTGFFAVEVSGNGLFNMVGGSVTGDTSGAILVSDGFGQVSFAGTEVRSDNRYGIVVTPSSDGANLIFSNGASLTGGNGTLLLNDSHASGVVNLTGDDNVTFIGDVNARNALGGTTNIALSGNSSLTGAVNVNQLTGADGIEPVEDVIFLPPMNVNMDIDSTSVWNMQKSSTVDTLNVAPGARIVFPAFRTLAVNRLTGTGGIFQMEVDLGEVRGDLIHIQTFSEGKHSLALANLSPASELPENRALLVVRTPDGGASSFSGEVDGGVFRYTVVRGDGSSHIPNPNDWYIVPLGGPDDPDEPIRPSDRLTPPANDAIGTFTATFPTFHADFPVVADRLTELRMSRGRQLRATRELSPTTSPSDFKESKEVKATPLPSTGFWVRGFGNETEIDPRQSREFDQLLGGGEIGFDKRFDVAEGDLYVGAFAGYLRATRDFKDGSEGTTDALNVGLYGEWYHPSGWFVDVIIKHTYLWNDFSAPTTQSTVDADYTVPTFGGMLTVGKRWDITNVFIEPYASLAGGWGASTDYEMSNGLEVHAGEQTSLRGRLGIRAGVHCECSNGQVIEPYARVGVMNEFLGDNEITMNGFDFRPRLSGAVVEASAGVAATLNQTFSVYAEYSYANGDKIRSPWAANLGLRWEW